MKRLIVTADDFGLTAKVNQGIIEGHLHGIVTSTSLMANGGAFDDAVSRLKDVPRLGIGIHLNLTEGSPISKPTVVRSLINEEGRMRVGPVGLGKKITTGQTKLGEVELELRAQIEKTLAAGVNLTHIDGHKHIQLLPGVFEIAIQLAREYGIEGIRCAAEPGVGIGNLMKARRNGSRGLKQFALAKALSLFALKLRRNAKRAGLYSPAHFLGITQTGFLDFGELSRILNNLPEGTSELMSHPGYVDQDLRRTPTRLLQSREQELKALIDERARDLITKNGIELITYRELGKAK